VILSPKELGLSVQSKSNQVHNRQLNIHR